MDVKLLKGPETLVTVTALKEITDTLATIAASNLGPQCRQTLVCSATGNIFGSSDGITILSAMQLTHPLAKLVQEAIKKYSDFCGDGTKTFILYLMGALSCVENLISNGGGLTSLGNVRGIPFQHTECDKQYCHSVAISLQEVLVNLLPKVLKKLSTKAITLKSNAEKDILAVHISAVINTIISPHFSSSDSSTLSVLLQNVICGERTFTSPAALLAKIIFYIDHFSSLTLCVAGQPFKFSFCLPGILLQRDFSELNPELLLMSNIRFVLLQCSLEGNSCKHPQEIITLATDDMANKAVNQKINNANLFLQKLKRLGVNVILTTEKVPEYVLSACKMHGLSVVCYIEEEDIHVLELITGKLSLQSIFDPVEDIHIGSAEFCRQHIIVNKNYIHLRFAELDMDLIHLVLCAPTDGTYRHLSHVILKTLKSVRMCFVGTDTNHPDGIIRDASTQGGSRYTHNPDQAFLTCITTGFVDEVRANFANVSELHQTIISPCHVYHYNLYKTGVKLIQGGGYFEFVLAQLLKEESEHFLHKKWGTACRVVHDGLLACTQRLHDSLNQINSDSRRNFLNVQVDVESALHKGEICYLSRLGKMETLPNPISGSPVSQVLEPLSLKIHVVESVLQLLIQMMRLESIISIRKQPGGKKTQTSKCSGD